MSERLTWEQIVDNYPNKWVALTDCEYTDKDGVNIESAVVIASLYGKEYDKFRINNFGKGYKYRCTSEELTSGVTYGDESIKVGLR